MKLQLKNWKVNNLTFNVVEKDSKNENTFDLDTTSIFSEDENDNIFRIEFDLSIFDVSFDIIVNAVFNFEIKDGVVTEEFKSSSFPKINAPAIAFPFLRAYISNLTLQSGFEPIILPSINFVNFVEENKNKPTN